LVYAQVPSDFPRHQLAALISDVRHSDGYVYTTRDHLGHVMDCAKIIRNPESLLIDEFIAVYHTYIDGLPKVNLARSTDLINWEFVKQIGDKASQPAILALKQDGGFLIVWEQEPSNHLKFVYYKSWLDLKEGIQTKSYDAFRTLSPCAEGTPNIYPNSTLAQIDLGFHYYQNCQVDRQARGTLRNFSLWSGGKKQNGFDNAILHYGVKGNIGDRDFIEYNSHNYALIEGQYEKNDFGTWRTFLYDYQTGNADQLKIQTHGGSKAFANPTITLTSLKGQRIILVTFFVPGEESAPGEAGELIYYRKY